MTEDYCMTCYDPDGDDDTGEFDVEPFTITDDDDEE